MHYQNQKELKYKGLRVNLLMNPMSPIIAMNHEESELFAIQSRFSVDRTGRLSKFQTNKKLLFVLSSDSQLISGNFKMLPIHSSGGA